MSENQVYQDMALGIKQDIEKQIEYVYPEKRERIKEQLQNMFAYAFEAGRKHQIDVDRKNARKKMKKHV